MAVSVETEVTTTWAKLIVVATTTWSLQNNGVKDIQLFWKTGLVAPVAGDVGYTLKPGQRADSTIEQIGDVWIKTSSGTSKVIINS